MNASTVIASVFLILILIPAIRGCITHLKGEGSCCGGTRQKPSSKKLQDPVLAKYRIEIEGMHCDHCSTRIQNELNRLDGISAKVSHTRKNAVVLCSREISPDRLKECIENLSYTVTGIKKIR